MIDATDLTGVDADLALRIIAVARTIAPCLDNLDGVPKATAIAILKSIAKEARSRGSRNIRRQAVGPASIEYTSSDSWFSDDDRASLRSLCGTAMSSGDPIGSFPRPGVVNRMWPEDCD